MSLYAVTAAGAPTSVELARLTGAAWEALMPVPAAERGQENLSCLERVVRSVLELPGLQRYFVVAPLQVQARLSHLGVEWVDAGDGGGAENFLRALRLCGDAQRVVCTTADLPAATGESLADFVSRCDPDLEVSYSVCTRGEMEQVFPAYPRSYVRLREGEFTGGGVTVVHPQPFLQRQEEFHETFATRKNSYRMALALGAPILLGRLTGGARKATVEAAFSKWARLRCGTVSIDPRWALDIDLEDDIHYLRWWVRRHGA